MSESIHIKESARQFMLLDVISRRIEDADKIKRTMTINNAEAAESFKRSHISVLFSYRIKKSLYAKRSRSSFIYIQTQRWQPKGGL
jgi:hypothetical protein